MGFEVIEGPAKILWATLVAEYDLAKNEDVRTRLASLANNAWTSFQEFDAVKSHGAANIGDRFYAYQVEHSAKLFDDEAFLSLKDAMGEVFGAAMTTFFNEQVSPKQKANVFCWATVGGGSTSASGGSFHPPHHHKNSALSAVFYVTAPAQSAPITFMDPRQTGNIHEHAPRQGSVVVFPSSLLHYVSVSNSETTRVSFSCNLPGR